MHRRPFFARQPKWQILFAELISLGLYWHLTRRLGGAEGNRLAIGVDFTILVVGLLFWPLFFSQFVLPVRTLKERFLAYWLLVRYYFGEHGAALRIQDGKLVERSGERIKTGPGVVLLDAASAAVLRSDVAFTRSVGPGLYFINYNPRQNGAEYVAGAISLQAQSRTTGPRDGEDPYLARQKGETEDEFRARQARRWETSGLTRDGLEVTPAITVVFRLESRQGEGGSGFGYNPVAVWRAVTGEAVDPHLSPGDALHTVSWEWLPSRLAADAWREILRMYTMDELFQVTFQGNTGLELIKEAIRQRLTQAKITELDEFGRPTGRQVVSPEFTLLLRRGLRVISVSLSSLRVPPPVDEQLLRRWESTWLQHARQERETLDVQRSYARDAGQRVALMEYAQAAAHQFTAETVETLARARLEGPTLLKLLVEGTLQMCVRDPALHRRTSNEKSELVDMLGYIQQKP